MSKKLYMVTLQFTDLGGLHQDKVLAICTNLESAKNCVKDYITQYDITEYYKEKWVDCQCEDMTLTDRFYVNINNAEGGRPFVYYISILTILPNQDLQYLQFYKLMNFKKEYIKKEHIKHGNQ